MSRNAILYSYWRSSCSWRVRIALNVQNIAYEYKAVHLLQDGGQQKSEQYKAMNASELIPTLKIDDVTLSQSVAILEYLHETDKTSTLLPSDVKQRARVRKVVQMIASDIQPVQNLRVLLKVIEVGGDKKQWGQQWIAKGFEAVEAELTQTAGLCCFGDTVTLADVCLVPQVYNANRFQVDMSNFPTIQKVHAHLIKLEAFVKAHPDQQPDANPQ